MLTIITVLGTTWVSAMGYYIRVNITKPINPAQK